MIVRIAKVVARVVEVGSGNSVLIRPITINKAISDIIATATVHATTIVAPLQFIITLPTTIATTTYFQTSLHYLHKSLYELVLYLEQNHIKHYDLYCD